MRRLSPKQWAAARERRRREEERRRREADIATCDACHEVVHKDGDGKWTDCRCIRVLRDKETDHA